MSVSQYASSPFTIVRALDDSPKARRWVGKVILAIGLAIWFGAQGALTLVPLWTRPLPPEPDDTLEYILRTTQMEECFFQDCPALEDLRQQTVAPSHDPDVAYQQLLMFRVFPVTSPLVSAVCLGLKKTGMDFITAHKMLWTAGPFLFGIGFAYLLTVLWGMPVAGLALTLLAFKVFPDTGLHHVIPSTLAMCMAMFVWARVISRQGNAGWTLVVGTLVLVSIHPVGRLYSLMAICIAALLAGLDQRRSWIPVLLSLLVVAAAFLVPMVVDRPILFVPSLGKPEEGFLVSVLMGAVQHITAMIVNAQRLEPGLFGSMTLFLPAVALGFIVCPAERRSAIIKVVSVCLFFVLLLMFYPAYHPGDVVLRIWIPLVVVLFGAVGQTLWFGIRESWQWLVEFLQNGGASEHFRIQKAWPVVLLALVTGYSLNMIVAGIEQMGATIEYLQKREPVALDPHQPEKLLALAKTGDRVLYNSIVIMPYYFIHGAMQLGAVYYNPELQDTGMSQWLQRRDLRFAVVYNPTMYHPSFGGRPEKQWWVTQPEYRHSPLSLPRTALPMSREGYIYASSFQWIDIEPSSRDYPRQLKIFVNNSGKPAEIKVIPVDAAGRQLRDAVAVGNVPSGWSGWVEVDVARATEAVRYRIVIPPPNEKVLVGGIVFGSDSLNWPWAQKAELTFMPAQDCCIGPITVSFDPVKLLPEALRNKSITVLDDRASSVLMEINQL